MARPVAKEDSGYRIESLNLYLLCLPRDYLDSLVICATLFSTIPLHQFYAYSEIRISESNNFSSGSDQAKSIKLTSNPTPRDSFAKKMKMMLNIWYFRSENVQHRVNLYRFLLFQPYFYHLPVGYSIVWGTKNNPKRFWFTIRKSVRWVCTISPSDEQTLLKNNSSASTI